MKSFIKYAVGSFFSATAMLIASCTGEGLFNGGNNGPIGGGDSGLNMGVALSGLNSDQYFCFSWSLFQEDSNGDWYLIDQREEPVCSDTGSDSLSDFATCYDGQHFLVQYEVSIKDANGEIQTATATSGGGPDDVCIKNYDVDSTANIQFNNEGTAGGVNPGIDIDAVCSNDKVQLENGHLVSALWLQPDSCECVDGEIPDSYCVLGYGEGISTSRYDITVDGFTRFLFNVSDADATWDLLYLAFDPQLDTSALTLFNSPFLLHHFADNGIYGREEIEGAIGSFRFGSSVGIITVEDGQVVVSYDSSADCDGEVDLDAEKQIFDLPTCASGDCDVIGVVATGGSTFDIVYSCDGDLISTSCDAQGIGDGICDI